MKTHHATLSSFFKSLLKNRSLIISLAWREVDARYRGTMGGVLWALFQPLLMLSIYTYVFSVVFKARWGQGTSSDAEYSLILFIGLFVFQLFTECVNRAPTLVVGNTNYVKKIIFPLEILPWIPLGAALFQLIISLTVWVAAHLLFIGIPPISGFFFPIILLPLILLTIGCSWILASLGVFIRDIAHFTTIATTVLFFMSPIFYPVSAVPERFQFFYKLNPLTYAVEESRQVLFFGHMPDFFLWSRYMLLACVVAWLGFAWFQKTRKGFADVL